jgi:hypothetical protein
MAADLMSNAGWVGLGIGMVLVLTLVDAILRDLSNRYTRRVAG